MHPKHFAVFRPKYKKINLFSSSSTTELLQCFHAVGWETGMASGLQKVGCWFDGGNDLTGALHVYL